MDNTSTQKPQDHMSGMTNTAETVKQKAQEYGSAAVNKIKESAPTAESLKHRAQEYGSAAMHRAKEATTSVAGKMGSLAGAIRENAPREGTVGSAATAVADSLESAGSYLQDKGFENMVEDLSGVVRRYPMQSLLVGVGLGYLLARRGTDWR